MRKTKIICTLGPAVDSDEMIEKLIKNGMDCARLNFSHGTHEEQKARMDRVKRVREKLGKCTAILLDTKGPEIRVKDFENGSVVIKKGQSFTFDSDESKLGDNTRIALSYHHLHEHVKAGTVILADDGKLAFEVKSVEGESINCVVTTGGKFSNHKSLNLPGTSIPMPYISEVDRSDILFGIEQKVDFIAASFVRTADDVKAVRELLNANGGSSIKIISKIENTEGIKNFDEILDATEGVMVARGDLGVELPFEDIPHIQKEIINKCMKKGKFVVTATQMLESMTHSPRPTRAEVSDVANAIYDGSGIIMLSGETAAGEYPDVAVATMAKIATTTEETIDYSKRFKHNNLILEDNVLDCTCMSACSAADYIHAKAIVTVTRSGRTSARLSDFYPQCPIIAGVIDDTGRHQMSLAFGVHPVYSRELYSVDGLVDYACQIAIDSGVVKKGDTIVIVTGKGDHPCKYSDTMKIQVL